ncbi:parafibromin-like [Sycon ciliatum]|uniref:parafibromin-like n=1 Tax=Sycon ciliatum TaxID=27933 RepID=UPI0020AE6840|eukprot:scpid61866/ scgid9485/ Parafibromin; Cell division cycle protein 73 homolog; Hyperparathyroidism 2 protein &gt; Parafibromin; Cell division cycle protein 73 homolog; Hyperparathyroidism 2 protein homolog
MAAVDPLSLLREFTINRKEIKERAGQVIFDNTSFPKTAKTNYAIYRTGKEPKDFYSLESLLFLLKNVSLSHPLYVQKAVSENIPVVRLPDRRTLLRYLGGQIDTSASIDKGAHLELGLPTTDAVPTKRPGDDLVSPAKRVRSEAEASAAEPVSESRPQDKKTSLRDAMSSERIEALRRKRVARKRGDQAKPDEDGGVSKMRAPGQPDVDVARDILPKERPGRTRNSCLQSSGKTFTNVLTIVQSIRSREETDTRKQDTSNGAAAASSQQKKPQQVGYNRYQQESFKDKHDTEGFKIDTLGSFHGMNLKSVAEGQQSRQSHSHSSRSSSAPSASPAPHQRSAQPAPGPDNAVQRSLHPPKRESRTPIIIIPGTPTSLITIYNAKDLLQDFKFVPSDERKKAGARRDNEVLIQRTRAANPGSGSSSISVPYRVTDNPQKLSANEWNRVVAVFVQGPAWQFKGWPLLGEDNSPVEIFSKIKAFHMKYNLAKLDANVQKWDVSILELHATRRHLDKPTMMRFWEGLDKFTKKNMGHLRL